MSDQLGLLHQILSDTFPAKSELASVEFVEVEELRPGIAWGGVFRLIVWDVNPDTGTKAIRDVKEQQVYLGVPDLSVRTLARYNELIHALVNVLSRVLAHPQIETLMPHDLLNFTPLR